MMSRNRSITVQPKNGGKHCPSLLQKRGCQGMKCHHHHDKRVLRGEFLYYVLSYIVNVPTLLRRTFFFLHSLRLLSSSLT